MKEEKDSNDQVGDINSVKFLDMQDYLGFDKLKQENESLKRLIDSLSEKLRDNKVLLKDCSNRCRDLQDDLDIEVNASKTWCDMYYEIHNKINEQNEEDRNDLRKSEKKRSVKILGITVFQTVVTSKS